MTDELKSLIRKRGAMKKRLTGISQFIDKCKESGTVSAPDIASIKLRILKINSLYEDFIEIQTNIEVLCEEIDLDQHQQYSSEFEDKYFTYISHANVLLSNPSGFNNIQSEIHNETINEEVTNEPQLQMEQQQIRETRQESSSVHNTCQVNRDNVNLPLNNDISTDSPSNNDNNVLSISNSLRLPKVDLPKFSGDYHSWLEFKDTFESLVHNNDSIPTILKFHYLRSSLIGSAAQHIQTVEFSATHYQVAWRGLLERYDNKRLLIHNHVKSLFELGNMKKDTHHQIRQLLDNVSKHLQSLKLLGEPTDQWDTLIIFIICNKLDESTAREWEHAKGSIDHVSLKHLYSFLKIKADELEALSLRDFAIKRQQYNSKLCNTSVDKGNKGQFKCFNCNGSHGIYKCVEFLQLSVPARVKRAQELKLCLNCLSRHQAAKCNKGTCRNCKGEHNSLLHLDQQQESKVIHAYQGSQILLSTAYVSVICHDGSFVKARALLDSGSQSNFITRRLFEQLGVPEIPARALITGISGSQANITKRCTIQIRSSTSLYSKKLASYVLEEITGPMPSTFVDISHLNIPNHIILADPSFNEPSSVDILLGAGVFWDLLKQGKIKVNNCDLSLRETVLGWIVSGTLPSHTKELQCNFSKFDADIQQQLAQFWSLEELPARTHLTPEEQECEHLFSASTKRTVDGRFIVQLPLKSSRETLGDSKQLALKRLQNLERKFASNRQFKELYISFMHEYESLGHMIKVDPGMLPENFYFLPHHGVIKESSQTTKLRVVFDGSAKTTSGLSVNDLQMVGPTVQDELFNIFLRFRIHTYVIGADIRMMYRQILVDSKDQPLQLIVWRCDPTKEMDVYMLKTVTYGLTSSPYLATRCLNQLAIEASKAYPAAAETIRQDFYVDDLLSGGETVTEVIATARDIQSILSSAGFPLHKWVSNNMDILQGIPPGDKSDNISHSLGSHASSKTLGLHWLYKEDSLKYIIRCNDPTQIDTKRKLLSDISQVWDPLGLVSPCVIVAKIMLQKLWLLKISWDEKIPESLQAEYTLFRKQLCTLNELTIPRRVLQGKPIVTELHGFSDASQSAYGACIYLRTIGADGKVATNILCARSRVAPLKSQTIPRLELCAALLLAELVEKVSSALKIQFQATFLWTDSTIVLHWLHTTPAKLQVFVANRVARIQELTNIDYWHHISSEDNPADILSRGIASNSLVVNSQWWHGPVWLSRPQEQWPVPHVCIQGDPPELRKTVTSVVMVNVVADSLFNKYSTLHKLMRVTAYMQRFTTNCRANQQRMSGPLSAAELKDAQTLLTKLSQAESFNNEILSLKQGKQPMKGPLRHLNPFIDRDGVLRVGGRLDNADIPFTQRHPAILSSKHILTRLIFRELHVKHLHAPPQLLLSSVRDSYWPIGGRSLARSVYHGCTTCFKARPSTLSPQMGNLPKSRITPNMPFTITGTDFAGPFQIRDRKGRGCKHIKCYVCLFICFSSKAIHLEAVTDLSTEGFMSCFKRFCSRRGKPSHMYSDNATNFVGANHELRRLYDSLHANRETIFTQCASDGISWHFIPPQSPHFGGLWEAGVKTVKYHLYRVMRNSVFTYEQFYTLLTQTEAVVNCRPLYPMSSDPLDLEVLTPSHFLIGRKLTSTPDPDYTRINVHRLTTYQHLQAIQQHFWNRWSKEYIHELQVRQKWTQNQASLRPGMLVLIKEGNVPVFNWKLGRVVEVFPGSDGIARVASIKTASGIIKRAFSKICPLPMEEEEVIKHV